MACQFRIVDFNFPQQPSVSTTASSSNTNFPASNLSKELRSRVWRSGGNFTITTSNNKINFRETSLGPEITATLTIGNYTASTLAAEIKSKMESASLNARTYTITQSGQTYKWTIAGQTFLELLFFTGTDFVNSVHDSLGFANTDLTGAITYTSASPAIHTEEWLLFDLNTAEEIDTFALVFDPLTGNKFSNEYLIKLQANPTDSWSSPAVDVTISIDEVYDVATHYFATAQEYRFWRVKIIDTRNSNGYVELGKVVLGKATQLTQGPDKGFKFSVLDQSKIDRTDYGHEYVDEYPQRSKLEFDFTALDYADVETLTEIFRRVGNKHPIFVSLDSTEELFDKDHFSIYGKMSAEYAFSQNFLTYFNSALIITEVF